MVRFNKMVQVVNPQLTCVYWTITVAMLVGLGSHFFGSRQYVLKMDVSQFVEVQMWVTGVSDLEALEQKVNAEISTSNFCVSPLSWDYCWDPACDWDYLNHTCVHMCAEGRAALDCVTVNEIGWAEDLPARVFISTQIMDEYYSAHTSGWTGATSRSFFTMSAEHLAVDLVYSYTVPSPGWLGLSSSGGDLRGSSAGVDGALPLWTVVLDSDNKIWKKFPPGISIQISLPDLMMLSGHADILDGQNLFGGNNQLQGGRTGGPSSRISGLEFRLKVQCFNHQSAYLDAHDLGEHGNTLCSLSVTRVAKGWVTHSVLDHIDGGIRYRRYHGVRLVTETSGIFEFIDFNNAYLNLISIIVVMSFPSKFVLYLTMYGLGHMSVIYKRVICEKFNMLEQVGGMTTRLMASSATFVQLEDENGGISMARMAERIARVMERRQDVLDAEEVESFVRFCFEQVLSTKQANELRRLGIVQRLKTEMGTPEVVEVPSAMDVDHFSSAYSSMEAISFDAIVDLFDRERKQSVLEKIFFPRHLNKQIHAAHSAKVKRLSRGQTLEQIKASSSETSAKLEQSLRELESRIETSVATVTPHRDAEGSAEALQDLRCRLELSERKLYETERRMQQSEASIGLLKSGLVGAEDAISVLREATLRTAPLATNGDTQAAQASGHGTRRPVVLGLGDADDIIMRSLNDRASEIEESVLRKNTELRADIAAQLQGLSSQLGGAVGAMRERQESTRLSVKDLETRITAVEDFTASLAQESLGSALDGSYSPSRSSSRPRSSHNGVRLERPGSGTPTPASTSREDYVDPTLLPAPRTLLADVRVVHEEPAESDYSSDTGSVRLRRGPVRSQDVASISSTQGGVHTPEYTPPPSSTGVRAAREPVVFV